MAIRHIAPRVQTRAPEETRREILAAAVAEFSNKGLAGARVDDIAARTRTTKRMINYYFGSKEKLYAAVLELLYGGMRDAEKDLQLEGLKPAEALQKIVEITFDHHASQPEFVRLVSTENINEARIVSASPTIRSRNATIIGLLKQILDRGIRDGSFRRGLDPLDVEIEALSAAHLLYDQDTLGGVFKHAYTRQFRNRVFFGIAERADGYAGFGAANAAVRMAAQRSHRNRCCS